ncbi:alpha/beta hydrolase [Synechococcus sp. BSA11S]|uniref:alpha/beta hydrolase n=1 Tax=Synechococcus sp. BSA11S TaxID=2599077 RepID=UPI0016261355|nr:alpha/beta hydrolase [Synechococcus sp. BSA11S]
MPFHRSLRWSTIAVTAGLSAGVISPILMGSPALAAGTLFFTYGPFERTLQVQSLEAFAATGKVNEDLRLLVRGNDPEKQKKMREALVFRADVEPILVSRFFNSNIGEDVLKLLGKNITMKNGANGALAIRGALVAAAFDKDGLSLLNVMKKLPVNISFNGQRIASVTREAELLIKGTETLISLMRDLTDIEAQAASPVDFAKLKNPGAPGKYGVEKDIWNLVDTSRQRKFYVEVYKPKELIESNVPVIVFSHGLSSQPKDYAVGLRHLASHGYVVAAPQHPGSDSTWVKGLINGTNKDVFDVNEFINRPKDLSYVMDELERRNDESFQGRLVLDNIGVAGHSFGGYTALAVGGAKIDFDYLKTECNRSFAAIDVSLLLECQALELPRTAYSFKDNRVTSILGYNPVNRSLFGPKGIAAIPLPTMFISGSYDPAAPPARQQAASFTWLTNPNKYWMMVEGQAHVNFDNIDPGIKTSIESVTHLALPNEQLIQDYVKSMMTPFFNVYVKQDPRYKEFLQSSYAEYLSEGQDFRLDFITAASSPAMEKAIADFRKKYR